METKTTQDYLKAIFKLQQDKEPVLTNELAALLDVSAASVTDMVKKLAAGGYVSYKPYRGVKLLAPGKKVALKVLRKHRLIELFLYKVLGMPWEKVHHEAETWEHFISEDVEIYIDKLLGYPELDPHGSPIPQSGGRIRSVDQILLSKLEIGQRAIVNEVSDNDPDLLTYLRDIGLTPGAKFKVINKSDYDNILTVKIGKIERVIGENTANNIHVRTY